MLLALMEHPYLVSASSSCKAIPERKFRISEESGSERLRQSKCVYIFQREYATVDPAVVDVCSYSLFHLENIVLCIFMGQYLQWAVSQTILLPHVIYIVIPTE